MRPLDSPHSLIASTAAVMGDVTLGERRASVWRVLRGDMAPDVIGASRTIQDRHHSTRDEGAPVTWPTGLGVGHERSSRRRPQVEAID